MDMEDLVKYGEKEKVCPFFLSKDTLDSSEIIFLPYNYLIDTKARKSMGIDVDNAIIIFDEAHNVESSCGDAHSFDLSTLDLKKAQKEVEFCYKLIDNYGIYGLSDFKQLSGKFILNEI
jgi:regulator of telomere elongation helicase 1